MAEYLITEEALTDIADAIREKTGITDLLYVADMPEAIYSIESGGVEDSRVLMPEQTVPFVSVPNMGVWLWNLNGGIDSLLLAEDEVYTVVWDGQEFICKAKAAQFNGVNGVGIGNFGAIGLGDDTGEPFLMGVADADGSIACYAFYEGDVHTIGVYDIGVEGGMAGGGASEMKPFDVHSVTFMDEAGVDELYVRSVADGDDCADPVERLLMDEPTKESTVQYVYDHNGWATVAGGAADSSVLKSVKDDKTVYAAFAESLRYYTINYFDDDGTTLLKTENLSYGSMPSYAPIKDGKDFVAWVPTVTAVTGNASYTATWKPKAKFETASWAEINEICAAGNHTNTFKIGDTKPVTFTYSDGTSETIDFRIVGMDVDTDVSGNKLPLSLMAVNLMKDYLQPASTYNKGQNDFYDMDNAISRLDRYLSAMPADLQSVIKERAYTYQEGWSSLCEGRKLCIPNLAGVTGSTTSGYSNNSNRTPKTKYPYFAQGHSIMCSKVNNAESDDYWTTDVKSTSSSSYTTVYYHVIDGTGTMSSSENPTSKSHGVRLLFCI